MTVELLREPIDDELTAPYWNGFENGEIRLPHCADCESYHWYPKYRCPSCGSAAIDWRATSGRGTVFTWVGLQYHFRLPFLKDKLPLYSGLVLPDEDDSIRLPALIDVPEGTDPRIGMEVRAEFFESETENQRQFPVYRPV